MNCALCIVRGDVPAPAITVVNGHAVCVTHFNDVIASPGVRGVTIGRASDLKRKDNGNGSNTELHRIGTHVGESQARMHGERTDVHDEDAPVR